MNGSRIFQAAIFLALALVVVMIGMPTSPAVAVNVTPWPTAFPLTVGTPWAPWYTATPRAVATTLRAATPTATVASRTIARRRVNVRARVTATPVRVATPTATTAPVVAPLPTATPAPSVAPSPTAAPLTSAGRGDSPASALEPTDTWQDLGAGASVWYVIGVNGNHMDVWLDASVHGNVSMAIYAPNSSFNDPPKGQGTYTKNDANRLVWAGGSMSAVGNWYARVTNGNPFAIRYKIGRTQIGINKTCHSYWEYIGTQHVYWTACE